MKPIYIMEEIITFNFIENNGAQPENMTSRIGSKIFDHLEMMEYYEYLKEFEESFISIFKKPETLLLRRERQDGPKLKESFLQEWDNKYATEHTKYMEFESGKISKSNFIRLFSQEVSKKH